ncbi:MAG: helix-turn-helix transcriptional regulator [Nitrosopumilaceae archaeon]
MGDSEGSEHLSEIFMELASDTRCEILKMLYDKPTQATKIANTLKLTKQETHRNTARLVECGFVQKNSEGFFLLTEYGRLITYQISYFEFLDKHKKFFEQHTVRNIPEKFVQRLGALQNTQHVVNVANVFEKLKKFESNAKDHLKIMVAQEWHEEGQILLKLIKENVTVHTLIAENSIRPDEIAESVGKQLDKIGTSKENVAHRQIERIDLGLHITETTCAAIFPNAKDQIDMNSMFVGDDEQFREWCNDVFNHYWNRSKRRVIGQSKK